MSEGEDFTTSDLYIMLSFRVFLLPAPIPWK